VSVHVFVFYLTFSFLVIWCTTGFSSGSLYFHHLYRPLGIIALRYEVEDHLYADDTQLCISLDPDNELDVASSLNNLEHCIADNRLWMTQHFLNLNDNQINIIYLASPHYVKSVRTPALQMGAYLITPKGSVKNIGDMFGNCINRYES